MMALQGRRVLYISYNGMLDPLGQSQVLPYLRELAKLGVRFTLLSFERDFAFTGEGVAKRESLKQRLAAEGIDWHWLRYHQRPSIPATGYDVAAGTLLARRLARRQNIELVHARGQIPAMIGLGVKKALGVKLIFDVRGLMADEYVDAGHWYTRGMPYRLSKRTEKLAFAAADGVVTLTHRIWPVIEQWDGLRGREVEHEVVPCCTDLGLFSFSSDDRERRRRELGFEGKQVFVYSGSIDGWYLTERMVEFFAQYQSSHPNSHLLWLTHGSQDRIRKLMADYGVGAENFTIVRAEPHDVPSYLSASDLGLAFIKPAFSKLASSPTKFAEYLACGLPLVINAGIGDSDELVTRERVGVLVNDFNPAEYARATTELDRFLNDVSGTRSRSREVAEKLFDVSQVGLHAYARLYERVLDVTK